MCVLVVRGRRCGDSNLRTNRELEELSKGENIVKHSEMDKGAKDKLAGSPGENGGR